MPEEVEEKALKELGRLEKMPPAVRRDERHPHLPRLARRACRGPTSPRRSSTSSRRRRSSTRTTTASRRSRSASSSTSRSTSSPTRCAARSCASSALRAWARPRSAARSPARSDRKFIRMSLGGVRDEAEIRGHRRTYVGALPGRIIQSISQVGTKQPGLHDGRDRQGRRGLPRRPDLGAARGARPRAELRLPGPLPRGAVRPVRRHVHHDGEPARHDPAGAARPHGGHPLPGLHRGREAPHRRAVPRPQAARGARAERRASSRSRDDAMREIIRRYTREAGVRGLERSIAAICRQVARKVVEGKKGKTTRHRRERCTSTSARRSSRYGLAEEKDEVGVATGLVWTEVGGDVIFIEATKMPGKGDLILTGQLGDVMRESATAARLLHPHAGEGPRHRRGLPRDSTTCTSTCRRPRSPRTGRARASRWRPRSPRCSSAAPCGATWR